VVTNKDLSSLIACNKFRKDLYYRLCAHQIQIPPLRERREDIPCLLDHFLEKASKSLNKPKPVPSREVTALLSTCHFEGNVRELHALVSDAVARHTSGLLTLDCFVGLAGKDCNPPSTALFVPSKAVDDILYAYFGRFPTLKEMEDYLTESALNLTSGNQRSAALMLGIARQTLSKRLIS
jgi:two-component system response regulator HydG